MAKRKDEDYEIESGTKVLAVLEALEGRGFEPVSVATVMERTGFNRDQTDRALKTLRLRGMAAQIADKRWTIGRRFVRMAQAVHP